MNLWSPIYASGVAVWICLSSGVSYAQDSSQIQNIGHDLAHKHCIRCHVVNTEDVFDGISSTPSFPLLVNGLPDWEARFESFHTRLPHPSIIRFKGELIDPDKPRPTVPVDLEYSDIEALVAYARTLKKHD